MDAGATLKAGARALGLDLDRRAIQQLVLYLELLQKWGRRYSLTALRDPNEMVVKHLLDSLAIIKYVDGPRLLDVGSGAGLPGIPLAVANPTLAVTLLESRRKPSQFLIHAVGRLGKTNIEVTVQRAERFRPRRKFDTLTARAFGPLPVLLNQAGHLCRSNGRILVLKGRHPRREIAQMPTDRFELVDVPRLSVPGLDAARHLLIIRTKPNPVDRPQ